jgi:transposase-like protein
METTKVCVRRTVAERRWIVELTLLPGVSVARVAQAEGVNSHQVFQWRRAYRDGELAVEALCALLGRDYSEVRLGG